ncbi:hypothetical protein LIER_18669 [Lithospermum erythrorhizon]|uniref:Phosphoglycerate mutase family protein n=1 Tax=Lithospermum erythrorhizon TaxID=34254 RepID=A0AAV3QJA0_LITER
MGESSQNNSQMYQNVVVMRHGDRIDNFDAMWAMKATRKWDPELVEGGKIRAFNEGRKMRSNLNFAIHRVVVSPFLRCLQTAAEVVSALSAAVNADDKLLNVSTSADGVKIDSSKIKVSVEYGLSEMMNSAAIRPEMAPKDGNFDFDISQCESILPPGTIDRDAEPVYKELPKWEESLEDARSRYVQIVKALADKYPTENLLLVTHGEGIGAVVSELMKGVNPYEVEYCAYLHIRRSISGSKLPSTNGELEVIGQHGISFLA